MYYLNIRPNRSNHSRIWALEKLRRNFILQISWQIWYLKSLLIPISSSTAAKKVASGGFSPEEAILSALVKTWFI